MRSCCNKCASGIEGLNKKYEHERALSFICFTGRACWNERDKVWMGYERKRGKLADFNAVLARAPPGIVFRKSSATCRPCRTSNTSSRSTPTRNCRATPRANWPAPWRIRSTARSTTPRGRDRGRLQHSATARGRSACPAPVVRASRNYSPAIRALILTRAPCRMCTRTVSGRLDSSAKAFTTWTPSSAPSAENFPKTGFLSHDLLEGSYARSALVTDVQLFEEFPARYLPDARRRHRWMRGDWQIATWLLPRVPGPDVRRVANPIGALSRWKIFDNLRRSLVPPCADRICWFWVGPFSRALAVLWSLLVMLVIFLPGLLSICTDSAARTRTNCPCAFICTNVARKHGAAVWTRRF